MKYHVLSEYFGCYKGRDTVKCSCGDKECLDKIEEIKIIKEALVKHEKENVDLREKCNEMRSKNSDLEKVVSSLEVKVLVNAEDRYNLKLKVNFLEDNLRCIIRSIV